MVSVKVIGKNRKIDSHRQGALVLWRMLKAAADRTETLSLTK
jgi:hypothetical protein